MLSTVAASALRLYVVSSWKLESSSTHSCGRRASSIAAIRASSADGEILPQATRSKAGGIDQLRGKGRGRRLAVAAGDGDDRASGTRARTPHANSSISETTGTPAAIAARTSGSLHRQAGRNRNQIDAGKCGRQQTARRRGSSRRLAAAASAAAFGGTARLSATRQRARLRARATSPSPAPVSPRPSTSACLPISCMMCSNPEFHRDGARDAKARKEIPARLSFATSSQFCRSLRWTLRSSCFSAASASTARTARA